MKNITPLTEKRIATLVEFLMIDDKHFMERQESIAELCELLELEAPKPKHIMRADNLFEKALYLDMDGTIGDLYGVPSWLEKLRAEDPSPYQNAGVLVNMRTLARYLNILQSMGWVIGIVSHLAKDSTPNYDELVRIRKAKWLKEHLGSVHFDEVHFVKYGTPKQTVVKHPLGVLIDDNEEVRNKWTGYTRDESDLLEFLHLIKQL